MPNQGLMPTKAKHFFQTERIRESFTCWESLCYCKANCKAITWISTQKPSGLVHCVGWSTAQSWSQKNLDKKWMRPNMSVGSWSFMSPHATCCAKTNWRHQLIQSQFQDGNHAVGPFRISLGPADRFWTNISQIYSVLQISVLAWTGNVVAKNATICGDFPRWSHVAVLVFQKWMSC